MAPLPQRAPPGGCLPCCRVWCRARRCSCCSLGCGRPWCTGPCCALRWHWAGALVRRQRSAAMQRWGLRRRPCWQRAWRPPPCSQSAVCEPGAIWSRPWRPRWKGRTSAGRGWWRPCHRPARPVPGCGWRSTARSCGARPCVCRPASKWAGTARVSATRMQTPARPRAGGAGPPRGGRGGGGRWGGGWGEGSGEGGEGGGWGGGRAAVRAGERWALTVRLKAPHGMRNPHGFDYELWLWEQGVQATGYVRTGPKDAPPLRLGATWRHPVERWRQSVRDAIVERLGRGAQDSREPLRARIAGVVAALVTGDQRAIERVDWELFRATGVAHLMSISGLHITLFAWLAALAVRTLWRRSTGLCLAVPAPSAALVAGVLLAAGYALFSGWGVPAQRTVIMLGSVACLQLSGRRWPWPQVWLLACAAVVLADPWALAQAGFWLSFVAVGVLFATNPMVDDSYRPGAMGRFHALLREQWVVTLALTPLTLLLFAQLTLVGFAANLVAIPWVTLVVTPLALAGLLWAPLWSLAALALQPLIALLQWLAQWPWAQWFLPAAPLWAGGAAVAGGALLALRMPWQLRLPALALLAPMLWWQQV